MEKKKTELEKKMNQMGGILYSNVSDDITDGN